MSSEQLPDDDHLEDIESVTSVSPVSTKSIVIVFAMVMASLTFLYILLSPLIFGSGEYAERREISIEPDEVTRVHTIPDESVVDAPPIIAPPPAPKRGPTKRERFSYSAAATQSGNQSASNAPGAISTAENDAIVSSIFSQSQGAEASTERTVSSQSEALQDPIDTSVAHRLSNNGAFIRAGAVIPSVLINAINSELGGELIARVVSPVYSSDGQRLLIPKGSLIFGRYEGVSQQGSTRIFILWNRIQIEADKFVYPNSGLVDDLGRSGLAGRVNTRFWERFGAAALLSILPAIVENNTDESSNSQTFQNLNQDLRSAATIALQSSINIAPIIEAHQARTFNVMVNKDLDFSGVL